jgi:hypothetical protein
VSNSLTTLYSQIFTHIDRHLRNLCERISESTATEFMKTSFVDTCIRFFASMLTTFATGYEILRYFTLYRFANTTVTVL